jgi:hypothetical protein
MPVYWNYAVDVATIEMLPEGSDAQRTGYTDAVDVIVKCV